MGVSGRTYAEGHHRMASSRFAPALLLCLLLACACYPASAVKRRRAPYGEAGGLVLGWGEQQLFGEQPVHGRALSLTKNKKTKAEPDWSYYTKKDKLHQEVLEIAAAHPDTFAVEWHNSSTPDGSYKADILVVTVAMGGIKPEAAVAHMQRYLIDFGQHGRELITCELGLVLLRTLAQGRAGVAAYLGGGAKAEALARMLEEQAVFKILPMENSRGRELVESGSSCERKNGRGVDPNRNYEVDWGVKEKDYNPNEEFPGTGAFSEPESQLVRRLATEFKPHVWLNIHSGMDAMFTPWDHRDSVPAEAQEALEFLKTIRDDSFPDIMGMTIRDDVFPDIKGVEVGSGGKTVGYLAHGTATDYMWEVLKIPMPFTFEIYGDFDADYNDCFAMFNPVTKPMFDSTLTHWMKAMLRLFELTPSHSVVAKQLLDARTAAGVAALTHTVSAVSSPVGAFLEPTVSRDGVEGTGGGPTGGSGASPIALPLWGVLLIACVGLVAVVLVAQRWLSTSGGGLDGARRGGFPRPSGSMV
ncbi:hypothetical protein FOA52_005916 [Chlamydomonas sp. UWO 241]|nr:hypothetical protein FOA52_005916 [Chlamydomonas sp. UWO 241]